MLVTRIGTAILILAVAIGTAVAAQHPEFSPEELRRQTVSADDLAPYGFVLLPETGPPLSLGLTTREENIEQLKQVAQIEEITPELLEKLLHEIEAMWLRCRAVGQELGRVSGGRLDARLLMQKSARDARRGLGDVEELRADLARVLEGREPTTIGELTRPRTVDGVASGVGLERKSAAVALYRVEQALARLEGRR